MHPSAYQSLLREKAERLKRIAGNAVTLPALHPSQQLVYDHPARFKTLACGRRWGKTLLNGYYLCDGALRGEYRAYFGLTHRNMLEIFRFCLHALRSEIKSSSQTEGRIDLASGGVIEFWTFQSGAVNNARGRRYHGVVLDEAAFIPNGDYVWNSVVRPMLVDYRGSAMRTSTAFGKNHFYHWFVQGLSDQTGEYQSWQFPTVSNPHINASEVESVRITTPERQFREEYLAEFLDDGGEVFRNVRACAVSSALDGKQAGVEYVVGVDLGKLNDYTVFAVMERDSKRLVYLDRFNQIDYTVQLGRLQALYERFAPSSIWVERNVGEMFIEQAQRAGLPIHPFQTTAASKQTLIDNLALAFEQQTVAIVPDALLISELEAYTMERLPSGTLRYNAPAGLHDDTVIALALAWAAANQPRRSARMYAENTIWS